MFIPRGRWKSGNKTARLQEDRHRPQEHSLSSWKLINKPPGTSTLLPGTGATIITVELKEITQRWMAGILESWLTSLRSACLFDCCYLTFLAYVLIEVATTRNELTIKSTYLYLGRFKHAILYMREIILQSSLSANHAPYNTIARSPTVGWWMAVQDANECVATFLDLRPFSSWAIHH